MDSGNYPESENTPELGNTPEPENTPEPDNRLVDPETMPWSEPDFEMSVTVDVLGWAWYMHVYVFATSYLVISIAICYSLCFYLRYRGTMRKGKMKISLQCLLLLFSSSRAFVLYVDPYHMSRTVKSDVSLYIWSIAWPGLTASFSVLLLVLLETTGTTIASPRFQRLSAILTVTAGHFAIVTTFHILASVLDSCVVLILVCQLIFILYGVLLGAGYTYATFVIYTTTKGTLNLPGRDEENKKIHRIITVGALSAMVSLLISVTHSYTVSGNFGFTSDIVHVNIWHWWIVNTIMRIEDISSCCLILSLVVTNSCSRRYIAVSMCSMWKQLHAKVTWGRRDPVVGTTRQHR